MNLMQHDLCTRKLTGIYKAPVAKHYHSLFKWNITILFKWRNFVVLIVGILGAFSIYLRLYISVLEVDLSQTR